MKKTFTSRLAAIDWIASTAENEAQFEVLREQLNFNYIYTGTYFLEMNEAEATAEIIWLDDQRQA
ncbi:MAG: hypothetical protein AAFO94_19865 [Bacteroidota bacterium]